MASVNKVILVGNLGRDPEVRYSPDGAAICNVSIATTSQWKDKASGERREETEWHRVVMYNRLAEIAGEYLKKGRSVYIEGRLKTRKWQDKDTGADRYSTEIVADQMQMLGARGRRRRRRQLRRRWRLRRSPAPAARRAGPAPGAAAASCSAGRPGQQRRQPGGHGRRYSVLNVIRSHSQTRQVDDLPGFYCPDERRRLPVHIPVGKAVGSLWKRCVFTVDKSGSGSPYSLAKT